MALAFSLSRRCARSTRAGAGHGAGRAFAEDDHAEHLVLGDVLRARVPTTLAVLHHADAVGEVEDVVDVVADQEDADALASSAAASVRRPARLRGPSAAVGSSMIRTRALNWIARAIATDWRWPPDSALTGSLKRRKCGLSRPITLRVSASMVDVVERARRASSVRGRGRCWRRHRHCRRAPASGRSSRCRTAWRRAGWRSSACSPLTKICARIGACRRPTGS